VSQLKRYLIIADDFTGANDTGVQLKRRGIDTDVLFARACAGSGGSVVIDTESRGMDAKTAFRAVVEAVSNIGFDSFDVVIKKVDSTLRGNIPQEVKSLDGRYRSELVVFAPALPDLGRTTVGAVHRLNGVPITQTELSRDPKKPVREDNITRMLQSVYEEKVIHVPLETVRAQKFDFAAGRVFTFDAQTNADMRSTISAALQTGKRILWVGTAAMADNLLEAEYRSLPSLGVVASLSTVTGKQIEHAQASGVTLIKVPIYEVLRDRQNERRYIDETVSSLAGGRDTLLAVSSSCDAAEYEKTERQAVQLNMSTGQVSAFTQSMIGEIACKTISRVGVSGVFLTGGDTAMGFFEEAGAIGSSILTEVAFGIPMMRLKGGRFNGLRVITKAGAFGSEEAITYSLRKLKEASI